MHSPFQPVDSLLWVQASLCISLLRTERGEGVHTIMGLVSKGTTSATKSHPPPNWKNTANVFLFPENIEAESATTSDQQDIQELLAITKKQIEERKKQNQALLAQQTTLVPMGLPPVGQAHNPLATGGPPGMQGIQKVLLNRPLIPQQNVSVHPLAYSRELHMTRGMSMGPSALDKAVKAAEVSECRSSVGLQHNNSSLY